MKFAVRKISDDSFEFAFDETTLTVSAEDLEVLLFRLTELLRPEQIEEKEEFHKHFMERLRGADGVGIQALLRAGSHDDILVLLRMSDDDSQLTDKLYSNMTEKSIKLYVEDLVFKYQEGVPGHLADAALNRLMRAVESLEAGGTLGFEDAGSDDADSGKDSG